MSKVRARVAFQGALGAFSHEACVAFAPLAEAVPFPSFEAAFQAVRDGACDRGLVPVENSSAGPVPEVAALLPGGGLRILRRYVLPVRLQLMAASDATLTTIRTVASHPMALKQCVRLLETRGWAAEPAYDTAGAGMELAARPDPARAVVAARGAARLYGLHILLEDVQDEPDNTTTFLMLARGDETSGGPPAKRL